MIKKAITFTNFDDEQVTEVHYFHLSKSELIDMDLATPGGMTAKLEKIGRSENGAEIMQTFREIIAAAYGERVDGSGSQFFKSKQKTEVFMGGLAFDALLTELLLDPAGAADFVSGIIPKDLAMLAAQVEAQNRPTADVALPGLPPQADGQAGVIPSGLANPQDGKGEVLPWAFREPTSKEMQEMTQLQLVEVYARKSSGWKAPDPNKLDTDTAGWPRGNA